MEQLKSFRTDRQRTKKRKRFLVTFVVLVCAVILFRGLLADVGGSLAQFVSRPFFIVGSDVSGTFGNIATYFMSKRTLADENLRLGEALDMVAAEATTRERLRAENDELKAILGRNPDRELILASVLAGPSRSAYDTLVIDIGSDAGIGEGMRVLYDGDFAVGEVTSVYGHSAVVSLYSSPGLILPVTVGSSTSPAEAEGVGGGSMRITVAKGLEIKAGDTVDIPALSPTYLGIVQAVNTPEGSSLSDLYISWPFNVDELKYVYIAIPTTSVLKIKSP